MRIISQDNNHNLPYDLCALNIFAVYPNGNCIEPIGYAISAIFNKGVGYPMAQYSTRKKADKAMEMLNMEYCGIVNPIETKKLSEKEMKEIEECIKNTHGQLEICHPKSGCKVWRFPKDFEIDESEESHNKTT